MRSKSRHLLTLVAVLFLVRGSAEAQNSVMLSGTVSETVALSVPPWFANSNMDVVSIGGNTVRIMMSGDSQSSLVRVPLLVRSNSSFKVSAVFESNTAKLSQLMVTDVHATGTLVSSQVVNALNVKKEIDPDVSQPLLVLSGPRVSLGGTLNSPNNALQVTLLVHIKPQSGQRWAVQLTFTATAAPLVQ
ncbi:MAG TPA: hypothetical protein VF088_20615 [Pyrinomonadaceae bacterium]